MKNKKALGKNMTFLIVGILIVLAFIKGNAQAWCLGGVFVVWAVWTLVLLAKKERTKKPFSKTIKKVKNGASDLAVTNNGNEAVLLRHLNCRISDYLKSVYPAVTWEWVSENPETLAAEGGTGKIRLFGVADFNYADIMFDQLARINCQMIRIVSFDDLKKNGEPESKHEPEKKPNQPADPETWYGIQGRNILEDCVADLHARGHASLIIKENGDVCVQQDNIETICDKFKNLPGKSVWQQLVRVIEKQGLSASVVNDCIKVSW